MSPSRKKSEVFNSLIFSLHSKSSLSRKQSSFKKVDNTIFFNHTINFGTKKIHDELKDVLGMTKKKTQNKRT